MFEKKNPKEMFCIHYTYCKWNILFVTVTVIFNQEMLSSDLSNNLSLNCICSTQRSYQVLTIRLSRTFYMRICLLNHSHCPRFLVVLYNVITWDACVLWYLHQPTSWLQICHHSICALATHCWSKFLISLQVQNLTAALFHATFFWD